MELLNDLTRKEMSIDVLICLLEECKKRGDDYIRLSGGHIGHARCTFLETIMKSSVEVAVRAPCCL